MQKPQMTTTSDEGQTSPWGASNVGDLFLTLSDYPLSFFLLSASSFYLVRWCAQRDNAFMFTVMKELLL